MSEARSSGTAARHGGERTVTFLPHTSRLTCERVAPPTLARVLKDGRSFLQLESSMTRGIKATSSERCGLQAGRDRMPNGTSAAARQHERKMDRQRGGGAAYEDFIGPPGFLRTGLAQQ